MKELADTLIPAKKMSSSEVVLLDRNQFDEFGLFLKCLGIISV